ncbi:MAG: dihydrolipoyl dehydrogenase [Candidatus Thermoplasmatota archaeon]
MMEKYDVIVIGNGVGGHVALNAAEEGEKTALVDRAPVGGTCQNFGCKPSKLLIHTADRLKQSKTLSEDGIDFRVKDIDFGEIMDDLRNTRERWQEEQKEVILSKENLDYFETECRFTDEYTLETEDTVLHGEKIFIAAGARPFIPPIEGLNEIEYLTNESILELETLPEKLVIIGGGYIGVEYAHFMSEMGTEVTIMQRGDRLVKNQDKDISNFLEQKLSERMEVALNTEASRVKKESKGYTVEGKTEEEEEIFFYGDKVLVAVGREPNTDTLDLEKTGVSTDDHGYIKVNDHLETSKEDIWALGDITGRGMFKHVANLEADFAWHNSKNDDKKKMDYDSVPNAVFTDPKMASVGMTESEARKEKDVLIGKAQYEDVIKGMLTKSRGFAKAVVEKESQKLLGFHIIGPEAPILLQETVDVIADDGTVKDVTKGIHTFPTLSRVITAALEDLKSD